MRSTIRSPMRSSISKVCRTSLAVGALVLLSGYAATASANDPISVEAIEVKMRSLVEEVPLTGSVYSPQIAMVSAQVEGLVQRVLVDAGDHVEVGAVLLELDPELTRIAGDEAEALREQAAAQRDDSERRLSEARELAKQNNIAASDVSSLEAQARTSIAELRAAEANVRRIKAELERHQIKAPFSGTVSQKLAAAGEWVRPGTGLFELVDSDHLSVDFQVPQRYYPRVKEHAELALQFDAYPGESFIGEVTHTVPLSRAGSRTFLLRGRVAEQTAPALIPGMSVSASLHIDTQRQSLAVPRDALIRYPDGRITVWVLAGSTWAEATEVREQRVDTGLSASGWMEITSGLKEGQLVVTQGNEALQDGRSVIPRKAKKSAVDNTLPK